VVGNIGMVDMEGLATTATTVAIRAMAAVEDGTMLAEEAKVGQTPAGAVHCRSS
jgi:hypothetical protein